ncbi:MAG TPA: type VI secretion system baseplate subunit TssE [Rhodopila sp.]|uniref:type VI secretion system baseplate subunit TssE n=1 Tax=Rhodopila sp. TaxID=2480087 RepID=UPI002B828BF4|nr:type VI secretion system baseplate subunit TssE [Rhodopila sp.]HVY16866.1 type VI secretion system baseplate subunit TssE [Rhodopila sp.]
MSGLRGRERLQPALLDRLTDDNPAQKRETGDAQTLSMQQLRQAVLRDLAWLLNATNLVTLEEDLSERPLLANSTLNYGIPGFAGMIESSGRITALEKELAAAIRRYEPRIRPETLRVRARGSGDGASPSLVFEIEGELWAQPVPQQLFLQTQIEVETRLAVVSEGKSRS